MQPLSRKVLPLALTASDSWSRLSRPAASISSFIEIWEVGVEKKGRMGDGETDEREEDGLKREEGGDRQREVVDQH